MKKQSKNLKMLASDKLASYIYSLGIDIVGFSSVIYSQEYYYRLQQRVSSNTFYVRSNYSYKDYIAVEKCLPETKTIISIGLSYHQKPRVKLNKKLLSYSKSSYGLDYHKLLYEKMNKIITYLKEEYNELEYYLSCDTKALDDRYFAYLCGNGFIGKNTMIINETYGSEVFYATILIDKEIDFKQPKIIESLCGECQRCEQACPTASLSAYKLNYSTCLSYLTQSKDMIAANAIKSNLYGCDYCNNACPYNQVITSEHSFLKDEGFVAPDVLLKLSNSEYNKMFGTKSLAWLNKNIIKKNAILCLPNIYDHNEISDLYKSLTLESDLLKDAFTYIMDKEKSLL